MPDLILEIRVPGYYVDDWPGVLESEDYGDFTVHDLVQENMRDECVLALIQHPGDGEMNHEFTQHAQEGVIVGARLDDPANPAPPHPTKGEK